MKLVQQLSTLPVYSIIMISGFGGAGKTTLARKVQQHINAEIVSFDDFYTEKRNYSNWSCYEYGRFVKEVLIPFKKLRSISYNAYNWEKPGTPLQKEVPQSDYLIIEGVGLFADTVLQFADFSIWIDLPINEAFSYGKQRDKEHYGVNNDHLWDTIWKTNDLQCFDTQKPLLKADYIYKR